MTKIRMLMILVLSCVLVICSCGASEVEEVVEEIEADPIVGFSQYVTDWPWMIAQTNSVVATAELEGYELIWRDADGSLEQQEKDIEELIELGVTYLLIVPGEEFGFESQIRTASQQGITVITLGREARNVTDNVICIQSDQRLEGQMAAQWLVEELNGVGTIVELMGNEGSSSAKQRSEGFHEIIDQYSGITVIATESADFTRSGGSDVMENLLRKYSGEIDAVFAHNDEMAIGAIQAIKGIGQVPGEDVIFVSVDGEKDALKAIIAGELGASIKCTPFLGPQAFDIINKIENGEEVKDMYIIQTEILYDESNARDYINKAY